MKTHLVHEANEVYKKLDELIDEQKRDAGRKGMSVTRVNLHRINNRLPTIPPFPFMVDRTWDQDFVEGKGSKATFVTRREDPPGFGTKKSVEESRFEKFEERT